MTRRKLTVTLGLAGVALLAVPAGASASPTCADTLGIANHAQHVVGDYVTGLTHGAMGWTPNGQVGKAIAGSGAVLPGGPGPGYHFVYGIAPGASFCTDSRSPGLHL